MLCPVDANVELVMSERQGVEIDYCPTCRGVWLDRGELDKILDRAAATVAPEPAEPAVRPSSASLPYSSPYSDSQSGGRYAPPRDESREDSRYRDDRYRGDHDRDDRSRDPRYQGRDDSGRPGYKKKRKESWLGDILDFG